MRCARKTVCVSVVMRGVTAATLRLSHLGQNTNDIQHRRVRVTHHASLLKWGILDQLLDEVDVCQHHATAAIPTRGGEDV